MGIEFKSPGDKGYNPYGKNIKLMLVVGDALFTLYL